MDEKGRVFVPKRFSRLLSASGEEEPAIVLSRGFEKCVFLFSKAGFERFTSRLSAQPFAGAKLRKLQRLFFSTVYDTKLDSNGRVLVPEALRTWAELAGEVMMVGSHGRGEIWNKQGWRQYQSASADEWTELGEILADDVEGEEQAG